MQVINGALKLHLRNADEALAVYTLRTVADLNRPEFADMDMDTRMEAARLLTDLESSPQYQADLDTAGQDLLRRQQERRANKRSLVVESTPQS